MFPVCPLPSHGSPQPSTISRSPGLWSSFLFWVQGQKKKNKAQPCSLLLPSLSRHPLLYPCPCLFLSLSLSLSLYLYLYLSPVCFSQSPPSVSLSFCPSFGLPRSLSSALPHSCCSACPRLLLSCSRSILRTDPKKQPKL